MEEKKEVLSQDGGKNQSVKEELPISLEDLNAAFQARKGKTKKRRLHFAGAERIKKIKNKRRLVIMAVCLLLLITIPVGAYSVFHEKQPKTAQVTLPKDILTEEELKKWEENPVDDTQVFFELNTLWTLGEGEDEVFIRLLNPPYSAFPIKVQIYLEEKPGEILYESELLEPGTIVQKVKLDPRPEKGNHTAIVKYSFYEKGSTDKIFGMHEVNAELTVDN